MITINETNFPDKKFRSWLLKQDYGKDGVLTEEAIKGVTEINVRDQDISSLKGIEHFTALTKLECSKNKLTTIDVSGCTALTKLDCGANKLTDLDLSGCTALTELDCTYNKLTSLNVSGCTALTELHCHCNQLKGAAMDRLIESLPQTEKESGLYVYDGYEKSEENVCTKAQVTAARAKGWKVLVTYDKEEEEWEEYDGCDE